MLSPIQTISKVAVVACPVVEALEVAVMVVEGGLHLGHFMEHPDLCETQKEPNMAMAAEVDMAGDEPLFQIHTCFPSILGHFVAVNSLRRRCCNTTIELNLFIF